MFVVYILDTIRLTLPSTVNFFSSKTIRKKMVNNAYIIHTRDKISEKFCTDTVSLLIEGKLLTSLTTDWSCLPNLF